MMKKKLAELCCSNVKSQTNNENHNYTVVMNCNYQSLEIEKCIAVGEEKPLISLVIGPQWFNSSREVDILKLF